MIRPWLYYSFSKVIIERICNAKWIDKMVSEGMLRVNTITSRIDEIVNLKIVYPRLLLNQD